MKLFKLKSASCLTSIGFVLAILLNIVGCGKTALIASSSEQTASAETAVRSEPLLAPEAATPTSEDAAPSTQPAKAPLTADTNQLPSIWFDANQIRYASMQNETWFFYPGGDNGPGLQQTVTGTVLVLSSDPNTCTVSIVNTVTANTFTLKILSSEFVAALAQTGAWPNPDNNTWIYSWKPLGLPENSTANLWCADCNIGTRIGSGHFSVTSGSTGMMVEATYPGQSADQVVTIPISTCSENIVAPPVMQVIGGNHLCPPIYCAP